MVEANQIDSQSPEPPRDSASVVLSREIGSECQIHAEKPDPLSSRAVEMAVFHHDPVSGRKRVIEEAKIGRAAQAILVDCEREYGRILSLGTSRARY